MVRKDDDDEGFLIRFLLAIGVREQEPAHMARYDVKTRHGRSELRPSQTATAQDAVLMRSTLKILKNGRTLTWTVGFWTH
jgi:hypothetical protein